MITALNKRYVSEEKIRDRGGGGEECAKKKRAMAESKKKSK